MLTSDHPVEDLLADPLGLRLPLPDDDIPVLSWPADADRREACARQGLPRVLVVAPGVPAPTDLDTLEDWVREPVDDRDLAVRRGTVARRHAARMRGLTLDNGLLWRGRRWVDLPPVQLAIVTPLVAQAGAVVSRDHLEDAVDRVGGSTAPAAFASCISRLRQRLEALDLELHALSGGRFVLEVVEP